MKLFNQIVVYPTYKHVIRILDDRSNHLSSEQKDIINEHINLAINIINDTLLQRYAKRTDTKDAHGRIKRTYIPQLSHAEEMKCTQKILERLEKLSSNELVRQTGCRKIYYTNVIRHAVAMARRTKISRKYNTPETIKWSQKGAVFLNFPLGKQFPIYPIVVDNPDIEVSTDAQIVFYRTGHISIPHLGLIPTDHRLEDNDLKGIYSIDIGRYRNECYYITLIYGIPLMRYKHIKRDRQIDSYHVRVRPYSDDTREVRHVSVLGDPEDIDIFIQDDHLHIGDTYLTDEDKQILLARSKRCTFNPLPLQPLRDCIERKQALIISLKERYTFRHDDIMEECMKEYYPTDPDFLQLLSYQTQINRILMKHFEPIFAKYILNRYTDNVNIQRGDPKYDLVLDEVERLFLDVITHYKGYKLRSKPDPKNIVDPEELKRQTERAKIGNDF